MDGNSEGVIVFKALRTLTLNGCGMWDVDCGVFQLFAFDVCMQ